MWIYTFTLTERVSASTISADWTANHPTPASTGVSVVGLKGVITATARAPQFADFAESASYINSIGEYMELPDPSSPDWDPPYQCHPDGGIEFVE